MITTLGVLGTGVIGAGWAARALHAGVDVIAYDVDAACEERFLASIAIGRQALARLHGGTDTPSGALTFTTDMAAMAGAADFIQESIPENLAIKRAALHDVVQHCREDVIIASSTSGIMPSDIQRDMPHPQRFCVGHPFNPVYLLPLVEVVGGQQTSPETLATARDFYHALAMHPLMITREIPGHISDRLQEALWREILHMLANDEATTEQLDQSIVYGPGLRWAIMGTNMIFHLAGGERGMRHMLEQFGPCLQWPWTRLAAPPLDDALIDRLVAGTQEQAQGRSIRDLEAIRDDCLIAIQQVLRKHDVGAGKTLNDFAKTR